MDACPCGSPLSYPDCCGPVIKGARAARTAEELMRSRYSAYVKKELDYIFTSLHPDHRSDYDAKSTQAWAESAQWHGFEIMDTKGGGEDDAEGQVEFVATFTDKGIRQQYHELSSFKKEGGAWYFTTGKHLPPPQAVRTAPKTGRNDPCPCNSGRKFKKCCGI